MKSYVERICKKLISVSLVATSYPNNELEFTEGGLDRMKYRRDFQSRRLSLRLARFWTRGIADISFPQLSVKRTVLAIGYIRKMNS